MKDLFKKYHRHKVLTNLSVLSLSAIFAISINAFLLSGTTGEALKASVIDANLTESRVADFVGEYNNSTIHFENSYDVVEVIELSFSLSYNSELLEIGDHISDLSGLTVSKIENTPGFLTYIISFSSPTDLQAGSQIISLLTQKLGDETIHLNISNVNFTDVHGEKYLLSPEGIMF